MTKAPEPECVWCGAPWVRPHHAWWCAQVAAHYGHRPVSRPSAGNVERSIPCPTCGAAITYPCHTPGGHRLSHAQTHAARLHLAGVGG